MRKFSFCAVAALSVLFISCKDNTKVASATSNSSVAQRNLDASHAINRAFETGDIKGLDSVVDKDMVDHTDHGDVKGSDSLKAMVRSMHDGFKDMKMELKHDLADDDYVFSWMRFTGTSNGNMGMAPGPFDMQTIEVTKFKDGKATEHWGFLDGRDIAKMMQQMQGMNMEHMPKGDSTKTKNK